MENVFEIGLLLIVLVNILYFVFVVHKHKGQLSKHYSFFHIHNEICKKSLGETATNKDDDIILKMAIKIRTFAGWSVVSWLAFSFMLPKIISFMQ
jgi:hypothetical protein